jgi:molybdopterin molybdotransferase
MIDLKKTEKLILNATPVLGRESVPILNALGRVVFNDISASEDFPISDISAMDGYALRHTSLKGSYRQKQVRLKIIGESPAGRPCRVVVKDGEAVRIMTGGLLPKGADTVIKIEDTAEENDYVVCHKYRGPGFGIRFRGESLKKGEMVLQCGDVIGPIEIGALASLRRAYVNVYQKPLVAILATGDELSDFYEPPSPEKTMCSNLYALAAQVKETGAHPHCLGTVKDDLGTQQSLLQEALSLQADVIITSGGTSKGKYDFIHKAFDALNVKLRLSTIFLKPGKPTIFGTIDKRLIFGLPGNPLATMLSFEQFIRPALLKMMGHQDLTYAAQGKLNSKHISDSLSLIDSFNYENGGNKEYKRASQIPLSMLSSYENGKCVEKHLPEPNINIPDYFKMAAQ